MKRAWVAANPVTTTTGTANAYVLTFIQGPAAYDKRYHLPFHRPCRYTGAATININSLGAKAIVSQRGEALSAGQIKTGDVLENRL
jgi:hypothetical protein